MAFHWFDGHLDLASLAVIGRDLTKELHEVTQGPLPPGVTFPSLRQGNTYQAFATLFTEPNSNAPYGYQAHTPDTAYDAALRQLRWYAHWEAEGQIRLVRTRSQLPLSPPPGKTPSPLHVLLLMEGADPIRSPEDVAHWYALGLRLVGLTWIRGTRYAGGDQSHGPLTPQGKALLQALTPFKIILDLSHLSERATHQLFDETENPVVATHSNCRRLLQSNNQRHLTDEVIQEIGRRDGLIGLNLLSRFLTPEWPRRRATLDECLAHIEHICTITGRKSSIALGSDMDGGFGTNQLPQGINQPKDMRKLQDALAQRGWSDAEIEGFAFRNWWDFLQQHLPENAPSIQPPPHP